MNKRHLALALAVVALLLPLLLRPSEPPAPSRPGPRPAAAPEASPASAVTETLPAPARIEPTADLREEAFATAGLPDLFPGAPVVESKTLPSPTAGRRVRISLIETDFYSKLVRVEELIEEHGDRVLFRTAMAADYVVVMVEGREAIDAIAGRLGTSVHSDIGKARYWRLNIPDPRRMDAIEDVMLSIRGLGMNGVSAHADFVMAPLAIPARPQEVPVSTALTQIGAPAAWGVTTGSRTSGPIIGVIDTGIDYTHPDLANNIWTNPANGLHGWDFYSNDGDPRDESSDSHGTAMAGVIGAEQGNGIGMMGVCPQTRIASLKISGPNGGALMSHCLQAIQYARATVQNNPGNPDNQIRLLNISMAWYGGGGVFPSLGWDPNYAVNFLLPEIHEAGNDGILIVTGAGNNARSLGDSFTVYPAEFAEPNIITVIGTGTGSGGLWWVTSGVEGTNLDIISTDLGAPAQDIYSTARTDLEMYRTSSGTSLSAAFTTGAAALVWTANPSYSYSQIRQLLFNTVTPGLPASSCSTAGRLNVGNALSPGNFRFEFSSYVVSESGTATIRVFREGGSRGIVHGQIDHVGGTAVAGADFSNNLPILSWADGDSTPKSFTFSTINDSNQEVRETVLLQVMALTGSVSQTTVYIDDNDVAGKVSFAGTTLAFLESNGTVSIPLQRYDGTSGQVTATVSVVTGGTAVSGSDFSGMPATVTWANGVSGVQNAGLTLINNNTSEPTETIKLRITQTSNGLVIGTPKDLTVSIHDDDNPGQLNLSPTWFGSLNESAGVAVITVTRTLGNLGPVSVGYATTASSSFLTTPATPGTDFTAVSGTLNWADQDWSPRTISVPILDDIVPEGNEGFRLTLSNPTGGVTIGTANLDITINSDGGGFSGFHLLSGDVTGDGRSDLVHIRGADDQRLVVVVYEATAGGAYVVRPNSLVPFTGASIIDLPVLLDVDGDGRKDLAVAGPLPLPALGLAVHCYRSLGTGAFSASSNTILGGQGTTLLGSGWLRAGRFVTGAGEDLVYAYSDLSRSFQLTAHILEGTPLGLVSRGFSETSIPASPTLSYFDLRVGDLLQPDSLDDLLVLRTDSANFQTNPMLVHPLAPNGSGGFVAQPAQATLEGVGFLGAGFLRPVELNADARVDFVRLSESGGAMSLRPYYSTGSSLTPGSWHASGDPANGNRPYLGLFAGHFNADGRQDLLHARVATTGPNLVARVHLSTGTALTAQSLYDSGDSFEGDALADAAAHFVDYNGDGLRDLVHARAVGGTLRITVHQSTGTGFSKQAAFLTGVPIRNQ